LPYDEGGNSLVSECVRDRDNGDVEDARHLAHDLLDLERGEIRAGASDDVPAPADEKHEAFIVDSRDVAAAGPSAAQEFGRRRLVAVVAEGDVLAGFHPDGDLTRFAGRRRLVPLVAQDDLISCDGAADGSEAPIAREWAHERETHRLCHAPQ